MMQIIAESFFPKKVKEFDSNGGAKDTEWAWPIYGARCLYMYTYLQFDHWFAHFVTLSCYNQCFVFVSSVSAFYVECPNNKICMNTWIWTKSKFLGMSVGVNNAGEGECRIWHLLLFWDSLAGLDESMMPGAGVPRLEVRVTLLNHPL